MNSATNVAVIPVEPVPKFDAIVAAPVPWIATCTASVVPPVNTPDSVSTLTPAMLCASFNDSSTWT